MEKFCAVKTEVLLKMVKSLLNLVLKESKLNHKEFTLIELLSVLAILATLAAIATPLYIGYVDNAEKEVCNANSRELERMYNGKLVLEGLDYSDTVFFQYLQGLSDEVCPSGGDISYTDGKVNCSIHHREDEIRDKDEDNDGGSVPYL
jgi:prepilin-type N-terminal cleavage/methylation domain-containing protein